MWWNGRRVGLKIRCWRQHVGSSPTTSTNVPRVLLEAFLFLWLGSGSVRVIWVEYSQGACSCFPKVRGRHRCKGVRKQIEWDSLFLIVFFTKIKLVKADF